MEESKEALQTQIKSGLLPPLSQLLLISLAGLASGLGVAWLLSLDFSQLILR